MARVKRKFEDDTYKKLASALLNTGNIATIEDKGNKYDIVLRSPKLKLMTFMWNQHLYIFEISVQKGEAEVYHICESYNYSEDKQSFINNLRSEGLLSKAGYMFALGQITGEEYPVELMKESEYVARQRDQITKEINIFKCVNLLEEVGSKKGLMQIAKEHVYKITKSYGIFLPELLENKSEKRFC